MHKIIIISIFNLALHPLYVHAIHKLILLLYLSFVTNISYYLNIKMQILDTSHILY